jgi:hypothetical protein
MLRIYVSSTYEDLVEERRATRDAIFGLGHFPVGMEDYAAADERPLDRCLRDVRSSHAYVGIVAWRYGYRPNGNGKSITQLEYEEARANSIPCFLFLLREDAPWPRIFIPDEEQPLIKAFRETLRADHLVGFFRDAESLARSVLQSLATGLINRSAPSIPDLLPYLCDRSDQEFDLDDGLKRSKTKPRHPLICIIHGEETEAHDKFLERLQKVMLPFLLPRQIEQSGVQLYRLEWPQSFQTAEEMQRKLALSLSKEVLDSARGTSEDINNRIGQTLGPVAIHSHLISENWQQQKTTCLEFFLQFWQNWPELAVGQQLIVFLFIKYQVNKNLGIYKLRKYRHVNSQIRKALTEYDLSSFDRLTIAILRELKGPTLGETQDWARSQEMSKFCDPQTLVTAISEYYAEWETQQRSKIIPVRIPTDQLTPKLKEMISRAQFEERGL